MRACAQRHHRGLDQQQPCRCRQVGAAEQRAADFGVDDPLLGGQPAQQRRRHRHVVARQQPQRHGAVAARDQRLGHAGADPFAQRNRGQQHWAGLADEADQIRIDQRRRILRHSARDDLAVLQQRQEDRTRRVEGVQQAVAERGADPHRRIVKEADQRRVEGGMFIGWAGVGEVGLSGEMRRLPALLAVARLTEGDKVLIRNHPALREPGKTLTAKA